MKAIRQGDVLLFSLSDEYDPQLLGQQLPHLVLAEGEATGHRHQISEGNCYLYQKGQTLYLKVFSESATLSHEEHHSIQVPQGNWLIKIQREYEPKLNLRGQGWRSVAD
jgi:hypothetical protein